MYIYISWTPQPVIVTVRDNKDHLSSYIPIIILLLQGERGPPKIQGGSQGSS